jgi:hypothetical protein
MRAALLVVILGLSAANATAQARSTAEARVEWRSRAGDHIIIDAKPWRCEGERCRGTIVDTPFLKVRACRLIARHVRRVTSFSTPSGPLSDADLARCNGEGR